MVCQRRGALFATTAVVLLSAACGGGATDPAGDDGSLQIDPAKAQLESGQGTRSALATIPGLPNAQLTWSVTESGGGTISSGGLYTAPAAAGTNHVVATLAGTTFSATATVTVSGTTPTPTPTPSPTPSPTPGTVQRPAWNTGTGFFTKDAKLYDPNGVQFVPYGVNISHGDGTLTMGCTSNFGLANSGTNLVRIVIWGESGSQLHTMMDQLISQKITPEPAVFNVPETQSACSNVDGNGAGTTTGNSSDACVQGAVAYWVHNYATYSAISPVNGRSYDSQMILNVANEWGPASSQWFTSYQTAITAIRNAGYKATIAIDSGVYGGNEADLVGYAQRLYDLDPQHNVIFSWHTYGQCYTTGVALNCDPSSNSGYGCCPNGPAWATNAWVNMTNFQAASTATAGAYGGWPWMIEEFGSTGSRGGTASVTQIVGFAQSHGVGAVAWGWDDCSASECLVNDRYTCNSFGVGQSGATLGQPSACTSPGACTGAGCACTADSQLTGFGNEFFLGTGSASGTGIFYKKPAKASIY